MGSANLFAYAEGAPTVMIDHTGTVSLNPGDKCPAFSKAVNKLKKLLKKKKCTEFFCDQFLTKLENLINDPTPVMKLNNNLSATNAWGETPCGGDPGAIWVKPFLCKSWNAGKLAQVMLHELAHFADCGAQNYPPGGATEEGVWAEKKCFGNQLGNQPSGPLGPPQFGPPKP